MFVHVLLSFLPFLLKRAFSSNFCGERNNFNSHRSGCAVQPDVGNLPLLRALFANIRDVRFNRRTWPTQLAILFQRQIIGSRKPAFVEGFTCQFVTSRSVVGQVAQFNLTSEIYLCWGLYLPTFVTSGSIEEPDLHAFLRGTLARIICYMPIKSIFGIQDPILYRP